MKPTEKSLKSQINEKYLIFPTKNPAIDKQKQINNRELYLFSEDITKDYAKRYILNSYQNMYNYIKNSNKKYIYENFEMDDKLRLHIDVDINEHQIGNNNRDQFFKTTIDDIINLLNEPLKSYDIENPQIIILKSKNITGKLSGHIIYPNIVFENIHHMKYFFLNIKSKLIDDKIIDPRVYKIGCLRMLFNSKFGKENNLEYYDAINYKLQDDLTLFKDSSLKYFGNIDYKLISINLDIDKQTGNIKIKKQQQLKNNNQLNKPIVPIEELQKYVDLINIKRAIDYVEWITIGLAIYNSNPGAFEVWNEWSKNYKDYDLNTCIYKWNSFRLGSIGFPTIRYYAKLDSPVEYEKLKELKYKHTDDILLKYHKDTIKNKIQETSERITDEAFNNIEKSVLADTSNVIILHQPTGGGKTYRTNKLCQIKINQLGTETKILSVVSRRTMATTHKKSFKDIGMTSYLSKKNKNLNRYIISLEQLCNIKNEYDVVILDEITSIISHFYSTTMAQRRYRSLVKLIDLIKNAKLVICADATITDATISFISSLRTDILYYRNFYKNKLGVKLNAFFFEKSITEFDNKSSIDLTFEQKIEWFCNKIKNKVQNNESIIIYCDSATYAKKIRNYLAKWNNDSNYFKLYTKNEYNEREVRNCNIEWINKCVIMSPKILYGLDIQIQYDEVYAIFKTESLSSFGMYQQISRSRNCNQVNILFLKYNYNKKINRYFSYKFNKQIEQESFDEYIKGINNLAKQTNNQLVQELCSRIVNKAIIDDESIFGKVHMFKTWYDKLFNFNKCQLLFSLLKEQGYDINIIPLNDENQEMRKLNQQLINKTNDKTYNKILIKKNILDQEIIIIDIMHAKLETDKQKLEKLVQIKKELLKEMNQLREKDIELSKKADDYKLVYKNEQNLHTKAVLNELSDFDIINIYANIGNSENTFADYQNHKNILEEKIDNRLRYLGIFQSTLKQNPELKEIIIDDNIFEGCVKSLLLFLDNEDIKNNKIDDFLDGLPMIEKDNRIFKRLELLEWIENKLGIKRFCIQDIQLTIDNGKKFVNELREQKDLLTSLEDSTLSSKNIWTRVTKKLDKLTTLDRIQKFVSDIYNTFFDNLISYNSKRIQYRNNNKMKEKLIYQDFQLNATNLEYINIFRKYV